MDKKLALDTEILMSTFGLKRNHGCVILDELLKTNVKADDPTMQAMEVHRLRLIEEGDFWNEEELKIQFIGTCFRIANINVKSKIKVFFERSLSAKVDNHQLSVIADCLVATPMTFATPQNPFFFLQEYKKGRGESKDPEAQMLMAMLIAQEKNKDGKPIYGSYLFGSHIRFTTLVGREYCISKNFSADEREDLLSIICILRKLKELILNR